MRTARYSAAGLFARGERREPAGALSLRLRLGLGCALAPTALLVEFFPMIE